MTASPVITRLAALFRADLDAKSNQAVGQMASEWLKIELRLEKEIQLLATELAAPPGGVKLDPITDMVVKMKAAGYDPDYIQKILMTQGILHIPEVPRPQAKELKAWELARLQRYIRLLEQVRQEFEKYTGQTARPIIETLKNDAALSGIQQALTMIDATISSAGGSAVDLTFDRLGIEAVQNITAIAGAGKPLGDLLQAAYPLAANGITNELLYGTATGRNPRETARKIIADGLSQGLDHILLVARDQMIRSYREASRQQYEKAGIQQYRRLAAKQSRTCLPAGTKIITSTGEMYIENIVPGVKVLTRQGYQTVIETMNRQVRGCFTSIIHGDVPTQLICTSGHLIWVESSREWRRACDIFVGEYLLTTNGRSLVKKVRYFQNRDIVYNLEVEKAPEYYANNTLVHNCLACLALDGSVWPTDELMPLHPQDRCLLPGQLVETAQGLIPIEEVQPGDEVRTHVGRLREVTGTNASQYRGRVVKITDGDKTLLCTPEHKILTKNRGWVEADKLIPGDILP